MPEVTGSLRCLFQTDASGAAFLSQSAHTYPLKIAKTFPFPNQQLGVYMMDASPGILSGDHYELDWTFGEGTNVMITNQSFTKVHPHRGGSGPESRQVQRLALMQGAYVEYLPEPVMLYKNARFVSETDVLLHPGSELVMSEIVCSGRLYRGESFHFSSYRSRLTVRLNDGTPIYQAKQLLEPDKMDFSALGCWGEYMYLGSLVVFSERADSSSAGSLRHALNEEQGINSSSVMYTGVSTALKHGIIVQVLGTTLTPVQRRLEQAWTFARSYLFHKPPLTIAK